MMVRSIWFDVGVPTVGSDNIPVLANASHVVHSPPLPVVATIIHPRSGPIRQSDVAWFVGSWRGNVRPRTTSERQLVDGMAHHVSRIRPCGSEASPLFGAPRSRGTAVAVRDMAGLAKHHAEEFVVVLAELLVGEPFQLQRAFLGSPAVAIDPQPERAARAVCKEPSMQASAQSPGCYERRASTSQLGQRSATRTDLRSSVARRL
jgi:hypothetical protein